MNLNDWLNNGWLKPHQTSKEEIRNLIKIIERDLSDAKITDISNDWRFAIAYNAALQICTIALYCSGYKVSRSQSEHYRTILSLSLTLGEEYTAIRDYLNACRAKRNVSDYDMIGTISNTEVKELLEVASRLFDQIKIWIAGNCPDK